MAMQRTVDTERINGHALTEAGGRQELVAAALRSACPTSNLGPENGYPE
jgi:hypothetical protein